MSSAPRDPTPPGTARPAGSPAERTRAADETRVPRRPGLRTRVWDIARDMESRAEGNHRGVAPVLMLRIGYQVIRQWTRDRCPQQAASLSFQTLLSLVPLIAVSMALLRITNSLGAESNFVEFLSREYIPVSRREISQQLVSWSENISFKSLGIIGLITTLLLAFILVNNVEKIVNFIWRSERKRSFAQKFVVFYAMATSAPVLVSTAIYQASQLGLTDGAIGVLTNSLITFLTLLAANYFLPATRVRLRAAAVGALVTTLLFELAKELFGLYATEFAFARFSGVYGAVAVLPLWLLWMYYSWLIFLLGVEVAHAAQNLHLLQRIDRRGPLSLENELLRRVNGVVAARLMVEVVRAYRRGDKTLTRGAIEDRFELSADAIDRLTDRLKDADLLMEIEGEHTGFIPARPPDEITLADVLAVFRGDDIGPDGPLPVGSSKLETLLADIDRETRERAGKASLAELAG